MTEKDKSAAELIFETFKDEEYPSKSNFLQAIEVFIVRNKDQELSELQAKYDKLKEVFEKQCIAHAVLRWATKASQEKQISSWKARAGL